MVGSSRDGNSRDGREYRLVQQAADQIVHVWAMALAEQEVDEDVQSTLDELALDLGIGTATLRDSAEELGFNMESEAGRRGYERMIDQEIREMRSVWDTVTELARVRFIKVVVLKLGQATREMGG